MTRSQYRAIPDATKYTFLRIGLLSGATVYKRGAACIRDRPPRARVTKFARGTMSFESSFVDRTRCKNAANCFEANMAVS